MKSRSTFEKTTLSAFLIFSLVFFFFCGRVNAQVTQPQFLITWKTTGSYVPSFYEGKSLPTYGSKITASLELVSNGRILNIGGQTIYWYLDDNLVGGGVGAQQITFPPTGDAPSFLRLKVELPNYNGVYLVHSINIPMVKPLAVIYSPYPNGQFSQNPVTVTALPYFFNVINPSNLSYSWSVNGQTGSNTENPEEAQITLPVGSQSGTSLTISLNVGNNQDSTTATAGESLTYETQL